MYIWPNGHCTECTFSRMDTCQNVHLAEWTFPRMYIFRMDTCQNVHLAEWAFPRKPIFQNGHLPGCTFGRMVISLKTYFPEWTPARMSIWPNGHFPKNLFSRMNTCQNIQLMLAVIIQDEKIKLFCSVSRVNMCFISGLVLRSCTVYFCVVLRVPNWKKTCQYTIPSLSPPKLKITSPSASPSPNATSPSPPKLKITSPSSKSSKI